MNLSQYAVLTLPLFLSLFPRAEAQTCSTKLAKQQVAGPFIQENYGPGILSWGYFDPATNILELRFYPDDLNCIGTLVVSDSCELDRSAVRMNCYEPSRGPDED